jgi:hypothetical protein
VITVSEKSDETWIPTTYVVGGPKILTNRLEFKDRALTSRFFTIETEVKAMPGHIKAHLPNSFEDEACAMRNRLLAWRFANFNSIDHDDTALRHLDPRPREIGLSLYAISPDAAFRAELINYLERRSEDLSSDDPLHAILDAIVKVAQGSHKRVKVDLKDIQKTAQSIGMDRELPGSEFTNRRVAAACRNLRFRTKRESDGTKVFIFPKILDEHRKRYKL